MMGKHTPQEDIMNAQHRYSAFVGKKSFYTYLADHRHELFRDDDFAKFYCHDNGRTSVPPSDLACALLLQWHDGVKDEEAAERAKFDIRWKVALGIEIEKVPFVKSTLQLFRTQLVFHGMEKTLFKASLIHARSQGFFKSREITVATDTTPVLGRGEVEDTYNMLAESIRQVLVGLAKVADMPMEDYARAHGYERYVASSFKGSFTIDWDRESERKQMLGILVEDCDRIVLEARVQIALHADDAETVKTIEKATELLCKIMLQDIRRIPSGQAEIIKGVAKDRIISVHDPEMRHGRKSSSHLFDGYKAAVVVDVESQLLTDVEVLPGNAHDASKQEEMLIESEKNIGAEIKRALGDTSYGSVELRLQARAIGRELFAPVAKPPQTGRFTKEDFQIDLENGTVMCPAGQTTAVFHKAKHRTAKGSEFNNKAYQFSAVQCGSCPLRDKCIKPATKARSVTVHEHEALLQEAKRFQRSEEFHEWYRKRSTVEHRIARLVQLGVRQARYCGSAKVLFQVAMTATIANLTIIMAHSADKSSFFSSIFASILLVIMLKSFWNFRYRILAANSSYVARSARSTMLLTTR
jgi:hypothetical protein